MAKLVEDTLICSGLDPRRLELEVTESTLIRDPDRTFKALGRIRQSGVTIALDDFGTGYSSLSTLRSFPFDRIKLDRSFVKDLTTCQDAAAIVHAVLGLAHGLGLPVIAEGVEYHDQLELLKEAGCTEVQGYLIGMPQPNNFFDGLTSTGLVTDFVLQQPLRVAERELEAATSAS